MLKLSTQGLVHKSSNRWEKLNISLVEVKTANAEEES